VGEEKFDLAFFYEQVGAVGKERTALRQDVVRGLKDYFEELYGYDKHGGGTIFLLEDRMAQPYVFGFATQRILHDRRISVGTKLGVAALAIEKLTYGAEFGNPFGLFSALELLTVHKRLPVVDLRYALVCSAGVYNPFLGTDKRTALSFFSRLLSHPEIPEGERAFWAHSLAARHQDQPGARELVRKIVDATDISADVRRELCLAWMHMRQPQINVPLPDGTGSSREALIAEHMPFWIAHAPSWSSRTMIRLGLASLPKFGSDPGELVQTYIVHRSGSSDAIHAAVADILTEHHAGMPISTVRGVVEQGIQIAGSVSTRRRFYKLGGEILGGDYLDRATEDSASAVRSWAVRELLRATPSS
jgi:hypothetical protein